MKHRNTTLLTILTLSLIWGSGTGWAGQVETRFHPADPTQKSLYLAGRSVDEAWEAFHHAALGGTLASPAIQTKIEQALHESRLLLVDARKAAKNNDQTTVLEITGRIGEISRQIKEDSQRQKQ